MFLFFCKSKVPQSLRICIGVLFVKLISGLNNFFMWRVKKYCICFVRYVVSDNRVVFTLKDGSKAWEVKEYLIQQERCLLVTLEGNDYIGKGHSDVSFSVL